MLARGDDPPNPPRYGGLPAPRTSRGTPEVPAVTGGPGR
jgi:hypothetical protein